MELNVFVVVQQSFIQKEDYSDVIGLVNGLFFIQNIPVFNNEIRRFAIPPNLKKMEDWKLTKEDKEKIIKFISEEILKNHMDKYKFRELVKDKLNEKILEQVNFEPVIKEATKSYKRSLGNRLGQQADRTVYELSI